MATIIALIDQYGEPYTHIFRQIRPTRDVEPRSVAIDGVAPTHRKRSGLWVWIIVVRWKQCAQDRCLAKKESTLVEFLTAKPRCDLTVVLTRVARCAGGHHVLERVAAAARDRLNTVALQRNIGCPAVRAPSPSVTNDSPLLRCEVVIDARQPSSPALCVARASCRRAGSGRELAARGHTFTVLRRRPGRIYERSCLTNVIAQAKQT